MDVEAAVGKVDEYFDHWRTCDRIFRLTHDLGQAKRTPEYNDNLDCLHRDIGFIEKIAAQLDERLAHRLRATAKVGWTYWGQDAVLNEILGALRNLEEEERILGTQGPKLAAGQLHPMVWGAAGKLWDDGHLEHAVSAAASAVFDSYLPAKLGIPRGVSAKNLASDAFSTTDPASGKPRLRFPGYTKGDADWTSAHEGAQLFGMGCAQAIRNLSTHGSTLDESTVLECLAALSLYARWIDSAIVET